MWPFLLHNAMTGGFYSVESGKGLQNPHRGFESHRRLRNIQEPWENQGFLFAAAHCPMVSTADRPQL
jgi:hypothetical protein